WALLIATVGIVAGVAAGWWIGGGMINLYNQYFRFPLLIFRLSPGVVAGAAALTLAAATLGAFSAVRRAVSVPPAEAMRPEPPAHYHRSLLEITAVGRFLSRRMTAATRMVFRN